MRLLPEAGITDVLSVALYFCNSIAISGSAGSNQLDCLSFAADTVL